MHHAKREELEPLAPLLETIRGIKEIKEPTFGHFYHKGKGILHFHVDEGKIYADLLDERILIVPGGLERQDYVIRKIMEIVSK
ncbi:MAG TPA: hypothetical protein VKU79_06010 [Thermoplasmataceae archaeon]|nr:hypothetical protein [Thermoplasmataceae archaeon]